MRIASNGGSLRARGSRCNALDADNFFVVAQNGVVVQRLNADMGVPRHLSVVQVVQNSRLRRSGNFFLVDSLSLESACLSSITLRKYGAWFRAPVSPNR